jgi:hypothetical protein
MKQIAIAAVALMVGFVLGGLGPREELRDAKKALATVEDAAPSGVGSDLARLLRVGTGPATPCPPTIVSGEVVATVDPRDAAVEEAEALAEKNPELVAALEEMDAEHADAREEVADELADIPLEKLDAARTALDLRRAQTRAALVEQLDPSIEQLESLDGAYDSMNEVLVGLSEEIAAIVNDGEVPERRDAMAFAADALDAMLESENAARGLLDQEQLTDMADDLLDPFKWVDPEILDSLTAIER